MLRKVIYSVSIVALIVIAFTLRTLWLAGVFTRVEPRKFGVCHWVNGPVGPEDITIHPKTGIAYISASDRRAHPPRPGAIFAYDLKQRDARPLNLTPSADAGFQPHGISLWVDRDGHDALFVINHQLLGDGTRKHSVQIFDLADGKLTAHATIGSPLLVMPNDLVAVGPDRFYLTNTHKNPPGLWQTIETYLRLTGAQVLYFDGQDFRPVIDDVVMPNGINVSPDGRTLYVASTTSHRVVVYDLSVAGERLQKRREIYLGMGADNIEVEANGTLWVAGHPQLLRLEAHQKNPAELSPSSVFRISPDGEAQEVYANLGEEVSGSSVAAVYGKRMLIGQIFDDGFLDCTLP
ncbi:MAG: strictosidine synthase family protein [Deltaproteobacteria bacterium]|nr:strictosidine synthase family protein [Deltaproteobacteria bacterium]